MENLRVLEGSEVFFRGLQHQYPPVQIRSAPLLSRRFSSGFFLFEIGFIITCIILQKSLYCQSTLSKSIRALEDEYKVILINRGAKKLNT